MLKKIKIKKFISIILIIFLVYSIIIEPNLLMVKKITLKNEYCKESYKIAFFSDTHFGKFYSQKNMERIVKIINENDVDIVIFGGDFFDDYSRDKEKLDLEYLSDNLNKINSKYGKYAIYGNHDFGGRAERVFFDLFNQSGFDVLTNQNIYIDELKTRIIGFEDVIFGDINTDFYNIKSTDFNILLSHEPDIINVINMQNSGIMFSGHTHGGQVYTPFIKLLPPYGKDYIKGIYNNVSENENISLFVSSGIGTTFIPTRFLNIPEVCIITLEN